MSQDDTPRDDAPRAAPDAERLTPLQVQQQRFTSRLRGCDPAEVADFQERVRRELEALLRERHLLLDTIEHLRAEVAAAREDAEAAREAAEADAQATQGEAAAEASRLISAAQAEADALRQRAQEEASRLQIEAAELRRHRDAFHAQLREVIDAHARLLARYPGPTS